VLRFFKGLGDGDYPAFLDWGEANAPFFMKKTILVNKNRSKMKVFEHFLESLKVS